MVDQDLTLVRIYNLPDGPDWIGTALEQFCIHGLSVNFISEARDKWANANLGITLKVIDNQTFREVLAGVEGLHAEVTVETVYPTCLLTVYGPHFKDRCGLAATAFRALGFQRMNILGISTSMSSISAVIAEADLEKAKAALEDFFELP